MLDLNHDVQFGGQDHLATLVDCTYFTKRKVSGSGYAGRETHGMQVCIVGFFELDLRTRQGTGKVFLEVISGETREEIEAAIRRRVLPGKVWTDGHPSYLWMDEPGSGYDH